MIKHLKIEDIINSETGEYENEAHIFTCVKNSEKVLKSHDKKIAESCLFPGSHESD